MEWQITLLLLLAGLFLLLGKGMPVAFSFLLVNFVAASFLMGFDTGPSFLVLSIFDSLARFSLVPIPLFVIMGEILFHSKIAIKALNALSKLMGAIPGRLSILSTVGGALFANLSGSTMANTAMLGSLLVPEMQKQGYHKSLTFGPILASGGLAMIIPPSALAVLLGALAHISIGGLLIGGILPGILMAILYIGSIVVRCKLNPSLAPTFEVEKTPLSEKISMVTKHVLPLGTIVFLVVGLIFIGAATPSESAAMGTLGAFLLCFAYRSFSREVFSKSIEGALSITCMTFLIIAGSAGYSQLLAYSGATRGLVETVLELNLSPFFVLVAMLLIILVLGIFMEQVSIMMITLPMFMPIVEALGFDPIWFGILILINLQIGMTTPPFGLLLFIMKGVAPSDTTMSDLYRAAFPFILCDLALIALLIVFPPLVTWLPGMIN